MNRSLLPILFAVVNAAGFPGVGTVLAGRRRTGWIQIGLSFLFMLVSAIPLVGLAMELASRGMDGGRLMDILLLRDTWIFSEKEMALLFFAMGGVLAYLGNLLWSLTTTRPITKTAPPPLPLPKGK